MQKYSKMNKCLTYALEPVCSLRSSTFPIKTCMCGYVDKLLTSCLNAETVIGTICIKDIVPIH